MNELQSLPQATPSQMLEVALYLYNLTMQSETVSAEVKAKLYPQFNREKSLFAFAVNKLFGGKKELNEQELQQAREFVRPYNEGFKALYGAIVGDDVYLKAKIDSPTTFNSKTFFETSNKTIADTNGNVYQLALKRFEIQGKWATNIVFMPLNKKATKPAQSLGTPQATQPAVHSFITPAEAIAAGTTPVQMNGHAPASL